VLQQLGKIHTVQKEHENSVTAYFPFGNFLDRPLKTLLRYFDMADVTLTDQNFKEQVLDSKAPVVVDFWAPWCGPCKMVTPTIEELAKEYEGKVVVGKMNVDENQQTSAQYSVMSIPTVMMFKNGQPVKALIGAQGKDTYKRMIEEVLAS
jgi:thioredoxin 1